MDISSKKKNGYQKENQDVFLKKHVGLIHCENKLTLIQRKISNILLFNALEKIHEEDIHEISLRQLCSLVGYNSNDSKLIKQAIKTLISTVMEWNLLEDNKFLHASDYSEEDMIAWNASSLLAGATIKNAIIRYSYSPQMKSVLSSLEIYGRINLFVQSKFNSMYSLVLYENCVRFKNIKQTCWFTIKLFRSLMGVSDKKYSAFKEFKRNVINVAVNEINQKSDIFIEPHYKKVGRHIVGVQFLLSENGRYEPSFRKSTQVNSPSQLIQQANLTEILIVDFHLSDKQVKDILSHYSYEYIVEKINLVKYKKNIDSPAAFLFSAIKNDYKEKKQALTAITKTVVENSYLREAKQASEILPLKNKYMSYKLKMYQSFVNSQNKNTKKLIKEKFESLLKSNLPAQRFYKKSGLSSPFVMTDFIKTIDENFPDIIGSYLSFDDYITSEET